MKFSLVVIDRSNRRFHRQIESLREGLGLFHDVRNGHLSIDLMPHPNFGRFQPPQWIQLVGADGTIKVWRKQL